MLDLDRPTWTRVKFGDAIQSVTDRVNDPSEAGVDRYVGLEHLDPGVLTVQRWDAPSKVSAQKLLFKSGDVIFGRRRAYQKKVARADFTGICSAHALVLRAIPERIDPDFLPVFLSSDYFLDRAIGISVGSLSPTVNWRDLKVQEFDLPSLDEQKGIADLLWAVEQRSRAVRAARSASLQSVDILIDDVVRKGAKTQISALTRAVVDCPHKTAPRCESAYAHAIGTPDIRDGAISLAAAKPISESTYEEWTARATPKAGDLILTREAPIGEVGIVQSGDRVVLGQRTVLIQTEDYEIGRTLWATLRSRSVQQSLHHLAVGTTVLHLNVGDIRSLEVPWPSTQQDVDQLTGLVEERARTLKRFDAENAAVAALRTSLLSAIFGDS